MLQADVNVVQLLSVNGDSQPLHLKRLQPSPQPQPGVSPIATSSAGWQWTHILAVDPRVVSGLAVGTLAALLLSKRA